MDISSSLVSRNYIPFSISGTERMRITNDGNVGVGTVNPFSGVHIAGGTMLLTNGYMWSTLTPAFMATMMNDTNSAITGVSTTIIYNIVTFATVPSTYPDTSFYAPVDGIYMFTAKVLWSGSGVNVAAMRRYSVGFSVNGVGADTSGDGWLWSSVNIYNNSFNTVSHTASQMLRLNRGDSVSVIQANDCTTSIVISKGGTDINGRPYFSGYLVRVI